MAMSRLVSASDPQCLYIDDGSAKAALAATVACRFEVEDLASLDLLDEHPFPVQCVTHAADCTADRSPRLSRVFGITRFTGYQPRDDGLGDVGCRPIFAILRSRHDR